MRQASRFARAVVAILCVVLAGCVAWAQRPQKALIVLPHNASAPLQFGAAILGDALKSNGLQVNVVDQAFSDHGSSSDFEVVVTERVGKAGKTQTSKQAPEKPESYSVSLSPEKHAATVDGSDVTGAMYGEFELAEQIADQRGDGWQAKIRAVTKSPYLEVRGVNMFLTVQDVDNADGAFWSDDYWQKYLDMMARDRYNFLDIHGLCDAVTLTFPNGFSYFLSLPDFPEGEWERSGQGRILPGFGK